MWTPRTRADELRELAASHLKAYGAVGVDGIPISPEPASPDGVYMREQCFCGRRVPVFELVDATLVPEYPGKYACGACREWCIRNGVIGSGEWVRRMDAPKELVKRMAAKDERLRGFRR